MEPFFWEDNDHADAMCILLMKSNNNNKWLKDTIYAAKMDETKPGTWDNYLKKAILDDELREELWNSLKTLEFHISKDLRFVEVKVWLEGYQK